MNADARLTILLLALALLALAGSHNLRAQEQLAAEPAPETPTPALVEVGFSGPNLVAQPRVPGVATSVYVSCADGTYIHREFEGVGAALVELVRADGTPVADGRCKYEVYVHPPVDEEAMRLAEETGDFATIKRLSRLEQQQTVITHGRFWVVGGSASTTREQGSDQ